MVFCLALMLPLLALPELNSAFTAPVALLYVFLVFFTHKPCIQCWSVGALRLFCFYPVFILDAPLHLLGVSFLLCLPPLAVPAAALIGPFRLLLPFINQCNA